MKYEQSKSREVMVIFRENRTYDLHINRTVYTFSPNGSHKLPASFIDTPDFKSVAHRFVVREV